MMPKKVKTENSQNLVQIGLVVLLIVAAFFVGYLWNKVRTMEDSTLGAARVAPSEPSGTGDAGSAGEQPSGELAPVTADDHIRGNQDATLALIEYSDYECPYCARFHPTAQQALDEYGDDLMWVYRHFPLDSIHPDARPRAEAAECAYDLGGDEAFWAYTDAIFGAQGAIDLNSIASQVGLDASAFQSCVDNGETSQAVNDDYQSGLAAGVRGTPGNFLLNIETGEKVSIPGAVPFENLKASIDQMLQ
jgi:protein-disulfide isomerase